MGIERSRMPVASKMALPTAGAMPTIGGLARPRRRQVLAVEQDDLDLGRVAEPRHAVLGELRVEDLAVLEVDRLGHRPAEPHDHRAFDLVLEVVRVDDGAAFEGTDGADDLHAAARSVDGHLGAGGDVAAFLRPGRDADPPVRAGLPSPSECLGRGLEHRAEPLVLEVLQPEFQRVDVHGVGQFVHVRLAGEVVGRRGQRPV